MFLLDANVLIQASRLYYAPDIAPTFWDWLATQHASGNIAAVEMVKTELNDGTHGHLTTWIHTLPNSFWLKPGAADVASMKSITQWVMDPTRPYKPAAKSEFLNVADFYLVAQCHSGKHDLVTFELPNPNSKKRVKIPDVCRAFNVPYHDPYAVYRRLGLKFS